MKHGSETLPASAESVPAAEHTSTPTTSPADEDVRYAICANVSDCPRAAAGAAVEWYPGAGEYCPECGEALVLRDQTPVPRRPSKPSMPALPAPPAGSGTRRTPSAKDAPLAAAVERRRGFWLFAAAFIAIAGVVYAAWGFAFNRTTTDVIRVCPLALAPQLAADLVRGYAAKTGTSASRFDLTQANICEVRFSLAPERPEAVIARDGLVVIVNPLNPISRVSKTQLRAIFSGSIHDWSRLGSPHGPIVPILPNSDSDEAKLLTGSLFSGLRIDRGVLRASTSADVTRIVAGSDSTGRSAIGLVAFRRLVTAKVVPLAGVPGPDAASIAAGRYPYTLTIGIEPGAGPNALASGLIDYAHSADGAAIVLEDGFVAAGGR
jgi:PBP superfamily domain